MFSRIRGFLNRHKRKFLASTVLIGSVIFLTRYTQRKIREWQEKEIREMIERSRRKQNFENVERTCNQAILSFASTLRKTVTKEIDTQSVVEKLRNGGINKMKGWLELQYLAIARSVVTIYSHIILVTLFRIQINLIGGYGYKYQHDPESNEKIKSLREPYLSHCNYFMSHGIKELCEVIQKKVKEVTHCISLKDELTIRDLEKMYWAIVSSLSSSFKSPTKQISSYIFMHIREEGEDPMLTKMVDETMDLLESDEVQNLIQSNIKRGFVFLLDRISEYFRDSPKIQSGSNVPNGISIPSTSSEKFSMWDELIESQNGSSIANGFIDLNKVSIPMAKLLPIINGLVPDNATENDVPTIWLQQLLLNDDLKTFGANVYEAFSF